MASTNFVGALRFTGTTAPMVLDEPMIGEWFLAYTQQVPAPMLEPGDVVILGNLPARKVTLVCETIEAAVPRSCSSCPTVPTSTRSRTPSNLKTVLLKATIRSVEHLWRITFHPRESAN